jgi:hypothetical protein
MTPKMGLYLLQSIRGIRVCPTVNIADLQKFRDFWKPATADGFLKLVGPGLSWLTSPESLKVKCKV